VPDSMTLCSIDGLPFAPCTSPVTYNYLETGSHDFMVRRLPRWTTTTDSVAVRMRSSGGRHDSAGDHPRGRALTVNTISVFEFTGSDDQTTPLGWTSNALAGRWAVRRMPIAGGSKSSPGRTLSRTCAGSAGNIDQPTAHAWTSSTCRRHTLDPELGPDQLTNQRRRVHRRRA
jgi:hypothetical protein